MLIIFIFVTDNKTWFRLLTSDWVSCQACESNLLLECQLEECIETTIDLYPDKIADMKGKGKSISSY